MDVRPRRFRLLALHGREEEALDLERAIGAEDEGFPPMARVFLLRLRGDRESLDEAGRVLRGLARQGALPPPVFADLADILRRLGEICLREGRLDEAARRAQEGLLIAQGPLRQAGPLGLDHASRILVLIAAIDRRRGQDARAQLAEKDALMAAELALAGPGVLPAPDQEGVRRRLAVLLERESRWTDAARQLRAILDLRGERPPPDRALLLARIGRLERRAGKGGE